MPFAARIHLVLVLAGPAAGLLAQTSDGGPGSEPRVKARGRVVRHDGSGWAEARVFLASSLFPNAVGPDMNDLVTSVSDGRGYFAVDLLADRTYAAWAGQEEPARPDGWRVYRASIVSMAGAGRTIRIVESNLRGVRFPVAPADEPAGTVLAARGLVHPPRQAEAVMVRMPLERDDAGRRWTPLWPYGVVPIERTDASGRSLAAASVNASLDHVQNLLARDGAFDVEAFGRLNLVAPKPAKDPLVITGRLSDGGAPVAASFLVRHVGGAGYEEVVTRTSAGLEMAGIGLPAEVWSRRLKDGVPEVALLATLARREDATLGEVKLESLWPTLVRVVSHDGTPAERAVVVLDTGSQPLGGLRTFAGRRGELRIVRPAGFALTLGARWHEGVVFGPLSADVTVEVRGARPVTVAGSVVDADGRALPGIQVRWGAPKAHRLAFLLPDCTWTDEKGQFAATLPTGDLEFLLSAGRFVGGVFWKASQPVDASTEQPVRLELRDG